MKRAPVPFVKMHGLGNDYVFLDERESEIPHLGPWARVLSDRHRGIGSDGVIVLRKDEACPVRMEMVNADGSPSGMCGNGIRCLARLARERGYATSDSFDVAVDAGRVSARIIRERGRIVAVSIDLGIPRVSETEIISGSFGSLEGVVVEIGNPHFVHLTESAVEEFPLERIGPEIERHTRFPMGINVGIASVSGDREIDLRVWERGAGETLACGSGATAAVAVLRASGRVGDEVMVGVRGGTLAIAFDSTGHASMTGPAEISFHGEFSRALLR